MRDERHGRCQGRCLLDHAQGHRGELRAAVLFDRRLQMIGQDRRAVQQGKMDQVIAHRAQKPLHRIGAGRVRGTLGVVVETRDGRDGQALHERAQRSEVGARVSARRRQGQPLRLISHGDTPSQAKPRT